MECQQMKSNENEITTHLNGQGGHKPGKHGKPGKLREFEKLSKSQGKLRKIWTFVEKTWKTQGKWKICDMIANKNAFHRIFLSWKLRENSGNLVSQKCGHPDGSPLFHSRWQSKQSWFQIKIGLMANGMPCTCSHMLKGSVYVACCHFIFTCLKKWYLPVIYQSIFIASVGKKEIYDTAKAGLTIFWELFTLIPCAPKHLKRLRHR